MVSLLPRWWGQGLAREAGVAAMRVGFGTGLERVLAMHDPGNSASQALIGRVGFQEWGALDVDLGALFSGLPHYRLTFLNLRLLLAQEQSCRTTVMYSHEDAYEYALWADLAEAPLNRPVEHLILHRASDGSCRWSVRDADLRHCSVACLAPEGCPELASCGFSIYAAVGPLSLWRLLPTQAAGLPAATRPTPAAPD